MSDDNEHCGSTGPKRSGGQGGCPFCCQAVLADAVETCGTVLAVPDAAPVCRGHLLIITRRHTADFFSMSAQERDDCLKLLDLLRRRALREDPTITGFNIGANCGASAGQRIMHAHVHFIPRRSSDPSHGGVKGVIRNKMSY